MFVMVVESKFLNINQLQDKTHIKLLCFHRKSKYLFFYKKLKMKTNTILILKNGENLQNIINIVIF